MTPGRHYGAVCIGLAGFVLGQAILAQSRTLPPRDESGRDPAFAAFLAQFRETVKKKDTPALMRAVSPDIKNSFGGDDGAEAFRRIWDLNADSSPVWGVLNQLLGLGGRWFDDSQYCAPYVYTDFPDDLDPFEHAVIIGEGVRLRMAPDGKAQPIARLTYEIVQVVKRDPEWTQVRTLGGVRGFAATAYLYSPAAFRACFASNAAGAWQMRALVAGD